MPERPRTPTDNRLPAWRRACLAYRETRQAGASDQQAHEAAVEAVQAYPLHDFRTWHMTGILRRRSNRDRYRRV